MAVEWDGDVVAAIAATVAYLALAVTIVAIGGRQRVTRIFAMLLATRGLHVGREALSAAAVGGGIEPLLAASAQVLLVASNAAAAAFLVVYAFPYAWVSNSRWGGVLLQAGAVAAFLALLSPRLADLVFALNALPFTAAIAFVAALLVLRARTARRAPERMLVSCGFAPLAAWWVTEDLVEWGMMATGRCFAECPAVPSGFWPYLVQWGILPLQAVLVLALVVLLPVVRRRVPDASVARIAGVELVLMAGAAASVVAAILLATVWGARGPALGIVGLVLPVLKVAPALLAGFALLRYQLFDVQVKLKVGIQRGGVPVVLMGGFFVVAQLLEGVFEASGLNWMVAAVLLGLTFFALHPLQRLVESFAEAAVPGVRQPGELTMGERESTFERAARLIWADGRISIEEHALLDDLRRHLGLSEAQAMEARRRAQPPQGGKQGGAAAGAATA